MMSELAVSIIRSEMPRAELNLTAPDFLLNDFSGNPVRLSDFKNKANVLLVFNRGFF
jgi:peroxiredoxin